MPIGSLIGAGTSILGGLLGNKSRAKEQRRAIEAQNAREDAAAKREYEQQKEFAKSGIQWKVEDARAAGIHPLYALGASTVSYAPQSVGGNAAGPTSDYSFMSDAGQNLGRAIDATRSQNAKAEALALTLAETQIRGAQLDNDIKLAQLNSAYGLTRQAGGTPPLPTANTQYAIPGQSGTPSIDGPTAKIEKTYPPLNPGAESQEYNQVPEVQYARTPTGWAPTMPQQLAESYENDWVGGWQWQARNKYMPAMSAHDGRNPYFNPPTHVRLRHGEKWYYNLAVGEWQIVAGRQDHWIRRQ